VGIKGLNEVYIYALVDPIEGIPRYIGMTQSPETRYAQHINSQQGKDSESSKAQWIRRIKALGRPIVLVILDCVDRKDGPRTEKEWMKHFMGLGVELFNSRGK
jgi:hypothetical protein